MLKHIGKHNNRKIAILYRTVPDERHMCLLVYTETLPRLIHDELMHSIESAIGQNAKELSDALFRNTMADGTNCLESLHRNGFIKKVPANQVLVTPTNNSSVRLDELNDILDQMDLGAEAIKKLADLDASLGLQTKKRPRNADAKEVGAPVNSRSNSQVRGNTSAESYMAEVLTDNDLAISRLAQAKEMKQQAESLIAEATRLEQEAKNLDSGAKNVTTKTKTKKTTKKQEA